MENLPEVMGLNDFQDYPEWRQWNIQLLKKIDRELKGAVIVPMTLYKSAYFEEIMAGLSEEAEVWHFQLEVDRELIAERLANRDDGTLEWGMSHIDKILAFFETIPDNQKISNQERPLGEVVAEIVHRLNHAELESI